MHPLAEKLSVSLGEELQNILNFWSENSLDLVNGGFVAPPRGLEFGAGAC